MSARRYVKENPRGGWDVLRKGERRSSIHGETLAEATSRARNIVRLEGGGEVRVLNRAGKVVRTRTVSRPSLRAASRRARGRLRVSRQKPQT